MAQYSASTGLSGAAAGAQLGGMLAAPTGGMSIPIGALLGAVGGLGLGFLGDGGQELQQGYDIVQLPQYSWTEPNRRLLADYLSQNLERMGRGEYPVWWEKAMPTMREGMSRGAYQAAYGRPGERTGTVQGATEVGAMTGVGPKATAALTAKAQKDYADREKAIDEYLTGLGVDVMREGEGRYMSGIMGMPGGPETVVVNKMGGVSGGNNWAQGLSDLMGTVGQSIPYWQQLQQQQQGLQNLQNMTNFGGGIPTGQMVNYGGRNYPMTTPPAGNAWYNNYTPSPAYSTPPAGNAWYNNYVPISSLKTPQQYQPTIGGWF